MTIETEEVNGVLRIVDLDRELKDMHYYGDRVRSIYVGMAVLMLAMSPFVQDRLPFPALLSVFAVVVLTIVAGLITPKTITVIVLNFLVSIASVVVFGKEAILTYSRNYKDIFFIGNFILSIASLFALYYSSKTLRGSFLYKNN